jgi:hypothetical protein
VSSARREEKTQVRWLMPVIPSTQEARIGRITVQGHLDKKLARSHANQQLSYDDSHL